ncbi:MAG: hypothetical protein LAT64_01345 [Phycisphaerales bacterium]|nr:hypothetical protein [Planctomycetota bacterium]MCH8507406.1 hypothetical protein [Phycisphaerales bacterium]
MEAWLPIAILALGFLGLLGVRVAFLLILRRTETNPKDRSPRWPDATVIRTIPNDENTEP